MGSVFLGNCMGFGDLETGSDARQVVGVSGNGPCCHCCHQLVTRERRDAGTEGFPRPRRFGPTVQPGRKAISWGRITDVWLLGPAACVACSRRRMRTSEDPFPSFSFCG